jgi:twinkle protein
MNDLLFGDGYNSSSLKTLTPRVNRLPHDKCGSSDALHIYLNRTKKGNWCYLAKCFSCGDKILQVDFKKNGLDQHVDLKSTAPTGSEENFFNDNSDLEVEEIEVMVVETQKNKFVKKDFTPHEGYLPDEPYRGVKPSTFEHFHAAVTFENLEVPSEITRILYPYHDRDEPTQVNAQKIRNLTRPKQSGGLYSEGQIGKSSMFAATLFKPGGKYLMICEGELDAMSAWQMMGGKYPCVSVKDGAQSLTNDVKKNFEYINSFEQIRICMDPDDAGNEAVRKLCDAGLIDYGKLKLVQLSSLIGDVNDYLTKEKQEDFVKAFWNARDYQPEGVVLSSSLLDYCTNPPVVQAFEYPFPTMQQDTYGMRLSEFDVIGARSGIGKTSLLKEFTVKILQETNEKVGLVLFEEPNFKTLRSLVGMQLQKRIDLPDVSCSRDEFEHGWKQLGLHNDRIALWDVQTNSWELAPILKHIEFMVATQDIKFLYVDFLQCIKLEEGSTEERLALDRISETFAKLSVKKNIHITATTQLNRSTGEIRGSSGIEQFSHKIMLAERDKKHKDERMRKVTKITIDKNRFNGTTGPAGFLEFNSDTGRMTEAFDIDDDMFDGVTTRKEK